MTVGTVTFRQETNGDHSITTVANNAGWVEHVTRSTNLWWCEHPDKKTVDHWQKLTRTRIADLVLDQTQSMDALGQIQELANERLRGPFILPPICRGAIIDTGMSRLSAEFACGTPAEQIKIIYADSKAPQQSFAHVEPVTSTNDFNKIFELSAIPYKIVWEQSDNNIRFVNTILPHTVYDVAKHDRFFPDKTNQILNFWNKFKNPQTSAIKISINCTGESRELINYNPQLWDITWNIQNADSWAWSYAQIMEQQKPEFYRREVNLWVYNITTPLCIDFLIPWAKHDANMYFSTNKKYVMFDNTARSSSMEIPAIAT